MIHLLESEELLRKTPEIQELYRNSRYAQEEGVIPPEVCASHSVPTSTEDGRIDSTVRNQAYVIEDDIQRYILQSHGVPGIIIRIQLNSDSEYRDSTKTKAKVEICDKTYTTEQHKQSYDLLDQYRAIALEFVGKPHIREKAFFLRHNMQTSGYEIGETVDKSISFGTYANEGVPENDDLHKIITLGDLFELTRSVNKNHLILLSGSIT